MEYDSIQRIDPYDYEEIVAEHLRAQGYRKVTTTRKSGDFGADVLAIAPNGDKVCIQCKRYSGSVGPKAVQEIYAAKKYYKCDLACVYTTGDYTQAAEKLAESTGVELRYLNPGVMTARIGRHIKRNKKGSILGTVRILL